MDVTGPTGTHIFKSDVSTRATNELDTEVRASLALGFAIAVSAVADASEVPIYKCIQADGGVLYTDALCKGGALLDIRFSAPDPAAINRTYYCTDPAGYYPQVRSCDKGWLKVLPDSSPMP